MPMRTESSSNEHQAMPGASPPESEQVLVDDSKVADPQANLVAMDFAPEKVAGGSFEKAQQ